MSVSAQARKLSSDEHAVGRIVRGQAASDGAGVRLTRIIGQPALPDLDPFLLLDEFRSDRANDYIGGFPDHPHRGFETVTYLLAGRMRHRDSRGNSGLLRAGSVQWMTAGRGIVHSEMPEQENGLLWGFQLWVNLKASEKMTEPRYQDLDPEAIPTVQRAGGVTVKVIAGSFDGVVGPVRASATDPSYFDITLPAQQSLTHALPREYCAFAYVFDGSVQIGPGLEPIERGELAVLGTGNDILVRAGPGQDARLLLIAGKPLKEPIVRHGPFVMNSQAQIRQALEDFRTGQF